MWLVLGHLAGAGSQESYVGAQSQTPHQAASLLVRSVARVVHTSNAEVSYRGVGVDYLRYSLNLEQSQSLLIPPSTPTPKVSLQTAVILSTRSSLLSLDQALGPELRAWIIFYSCL